MTNPPTPPSPPSHPPHPPPHHTPASPGADQAQVGGRKRRVLARALGGWRVLLWAAVGLVLALAWDRAVYEHLRFDDLAKVESRDWYRLLRVLGSMWTWMGVAVVIVLLAPARKAVLADGRERIFPENVRSAGFLLLASGLSGAAAEVLKLVVGRARPNEGDGEYVFRPFLSGFVDGSNLGMPSSHAAVAFGAAFALALLYPRLAVVAVAGAIGCGLTRILSGAHFLSDVYVGAAAAYAITAVLWAAHTRVPGRASGQDDEPSR